MKKLESSPALIKLEKMKLTSEIKDFILEKTDQTFLSRVLLNNRKFDFFKVLYKSNGHKVAGYIVQPKRLKKKLPVVIFNRGGSGEFGAIKIGAVYNHLSLFSSWGYVVFASQYSGNCGSEGKDMFGGDDLNDVLVLKKLIDAHPYADEDRIGMMGGSRGGMMTYLSLTKVKWIKAAVSIAGLSDVFRNIKLRPEMKKRLPSFFKTTKQEMINRSAVYWPEKFSKKTPLLLMHGTADWRVDVADSIDLSKKLYENKIPHKLIVYPGADHSLTEYRDESRCEIKKWMDSYVKNGESLPDLKPHGN